MARSENQVKQPRIIAELGINHNGSETTARALIDGVAAARVWGVKFQYRNLERTYAQGARQIGDEILRREIVRNHLSPAQIIALLRHGRSLGLAVGISFFSPHDLDDFGADIADFDFFKVPSVEFMNMPLVRRIESLGRPGLISTGAQTEVAVRETLQRLDPARWVPLHCVSNYPVSLANPKLGYMKHLRRLWAGDIGYSSHDDQWEVTLLALQMGASVIERHITLDKAADGLDHTSSSTPDEFATMARFAANMSLMCAGDGPRTPNQGELLNLQNLGRSYYARRPITAGEAVTEDKLDLRAPRTGLGHEEIGAFLDSPAARNIPAGAVIDRSAFAPAPEVSDDVIQFARENRLSLPVRFHDIADITRRMPIGRYEFHLSFGDVEEKIDIAAFNAAHRYSVHLPDYVAPTLLMDPFAPAAGQRQASLRVLERTADFASALQDLTGADVPVVGSFSAVHTTLQDFFAQHADLLETYRDKGICILPQWLPPVAWYFGGAVRLEAMNNTADIAEIKAHALPICMDVCHLCMGDKVFGFRAREVINELSPYIRHVHIADARGHDGEGVPFGEGDSENRDAIAAAFTLDSVKVIEVWQGHLHGGAGFAAALATLREMFGNG